MNNSDKQSRYHRIQQQLAEVLMKCDDRQARMASVVALLHHKMRNFFWTGFYTLKGDRLIVNVYQGPIACMELKKNTGVCWSSINSGEPVIVPDVNLFPGHIACDSRSKSEICVPFRDNNGDIMAVLDVDSTILNNFDRVDQIELQKILSMIIQV